MRERTQAGLFVAAWLAALAVAWAAVSAVTSVAPAATGDASDVRLLIRTPEWTIEYEATTTNGTAFTFLREASETVGFELDWVEYGWPYHDVLVTSINGTRSDGTAGLYWQYCVNGTYATRGAFHQEVRDGDTILWVYAPIGGGELCR